MTAKLYQEWISSWDRELQKKKRRILLLQDNFSAHIVPDNLSNIRVENFHANLTAHTLITALKEYFLFSTESQVY